MQQRLADFKERLLLYIYAEAPDESTKGFEFYFNLDPFVEEDGIGTRYATREDYEALLDPFLEETDRDFYWRMYQLQRAVDALARVDIEYRGNRARGNSEAWDAKAISHLQEKIDKRLSAWRFNLQAAAKIQRRLTE